MPSFCPEGWEHVSGPPSKPENVERPLPAVKFPLSGVTTRRKEIIQFEWEQLQNVPVPVGNCGAQVTFSSQWSYVQGSETTLSLGGIINIPGLGEIGEISGGYALTWSTSTAASPGLEVTVGPTECYEYRAVPVALGVRVGINIQRDTSPWYEPIILWIYNAMVPQNMERFPNLNATVWYPTIYIEGALVVCRHWCCEDTRTMYDAETEEPLRRLTPEEDARYDELTAQSGGDAIDGAPFGYPGRMVHAW